MGDRPQRVLHIFGSTNRGGAETFIMRVYRHIDRQKIQFDFAIHTSNPGDFDHEIRELGGRIFHLPSPSFSNLIAYGKSLLTLIRDQGPFQAVHAHPHYFSGYILMIARMANVPVRIAHAHNTSDGKSSTIPRVLYRKTMRRLMLHNATHLLGCSSPACEGLFGPGWDQNPRVSVLVYGLDLDVFQHSDPQRSRHMLQRWGIPENSVLIGHVGRFVHQKNHVFVVELFRHIRKNIPHAHMVFVGDGPLMPEIKDMVEHFRLSDSVHFLGKRGDVPDLMAAFDVFLFPSRWEGLGIVLHEAQAAGVPCVASDAVPKEADVGLGLVQFVPLEAPPDRWVEAVQRALRLQRPSWPERKQAFFEKRYDIQSVTRFLEDVYLGRR